MIFSFNLFAAATLLLLSVSLQADAHAAIAPVLGVKGQPKRNDVERPSNTQPCGKTNIAQTFDTSASVPLNANGTFTATITNFNAGVDGSRQITKALVDTTGTGQQFVQAEVLQNGDKNPSSVGSQQLVVKLPPGGCTGGATKDKCLVSLKTAGGFGNCVVVQSQSQGEAQTGSAKGANGKQKTAATTGATAAETTAALLKNAAIAGDRGVMPVVPLGSAKSESGVAGTRAPRAMRFARESTA